MVQSHLESFCNQIATNVCGSTKEEVEGGKNQYGFDVNTFSKILEIIGQVVAELVKNCLNKAGLKDSVRKPNFLQRVKFRNTVKECCEYSGITKIKTYSGKIADHCISLAATLSDEQVEKLVSELDDLDNMLI